jgi:phosphoenolpyruvate carboxykinase (ATP)
MNETNTAQAFYLNNEELISEAVKNNEGVIASNGAFSASTGPRTGRSPNDRFIVDEPTTSDLIDWGDINKPFNSQKFDLLWDKVESYLTKKIDIHLSSMLVLMKIIIYPSRLQQRLPGMVYLQD